MPVITNRKLRLTDPVANGLIVVRIATGLKEDQYVDAAMHNGAKARAAKLSFEHDRMGV